MSKSRDYYQDLGIRTHNWMKEIGAVHNYEKGTRNYMTIEDWAKQFDIELDEDGEVTISSYMEWQHVKLEMIEQGNAIAVTPMKGHYLGKNGEQASNVIYNIKYALARISRATDQLERIRISGRDHYIKSRKHMRGQINPENVIGLIKATKNVASLSQYTSIPSDELLLLISEVEEDEKRPKDKNHQ